MESNELIHHGVKGMKWGVRRYQNADGSLTELGKKKYRTPEIFNAVVGANNKLVPVNIATGAALGFLTPLPVALPIGAAISIVEGLVMRNKRKKITQIYDQSIATGKDITNDIVRIYGKQPVNSIPNKKPT